MGRSLWQTFDLKVRIKLSLCTTWSRMCGWNCSSTHPGSQQQRRVSGQFHNPGHFPFPSEKGIPVTTEVRTVVSRLGRAGETKKFLSLPRIEPQLIGCPAHGRDAILDYTLPRGRKLGRCQLEIWPNYLFSQRWKFIVFFYKYAQTKFVLRMLWNIFIWFMPLKIKYLYSGIKNFEIQDDGISLLRIWLDSIFWTMVTRMGSLDF